MLSPTISLIGNKVLNLTQVSRTIIWFITNGKEPHRKFWFMVISKDDIDSHSSELGATKLRSESNVMFFGIKIDQLTFVKQFSVLCLTASKQLNTCTRISKLLSYDSKNLVIDGFINRNIQY